MSKPPNNGRSNMFDPFIDYFYNLKHVYGWPVLTASLVSAGLAGVFTESAPLVALALFLCSVGLVVWRSGGSRYDHD